MAIDISARPFQLLVNGIDRTVNFIESDLSSNELGSASQGTNDVRISGTIVLQANYNQILDFTYLASPSIGANWAQGVQVIYKIANDSGALATLYTLYILKEPEPPDQTEYKISLQVGDQQTLLNYRSPDIDSSGIVVADDVSGVIIDTETARDVVIGRYLAAANADYSLTSIPYPFYFPQPKQNSFIDVAAQMARAANHVLYSDRSGVIRNKAIDLDGSAIATLTIGSDEKFFDTIKSIETPVGNLILSSLVTSVKTNTYPKVTIKPIESEYVIFKFNQGSSTVTSQTVKYISQRITTTDYGFDGTQRKVEIFTESSCVLRDLADLLINDPTVFLVPASIKTTITKYDYRRRFLSETETDDVFILNLSSFNDALVAKLNRFNFTDYNFTTRTAGSDTKTFYRYKDDANPLLITDLIVSKRTETKNYLNANNQNLIYGEVAKEESWTDGCYTVANFYKNVTLSSSVNFSPSRGLSNQVLSTNVSDWIPSTTQTIYAFDSSTLPPQTVYREDFQPFEKPVKVVLNATPFAGDAYKARSRPIDVPFITSIEQLTDYGNTFLALLYGRKNGFTFIGAISDALIANLIPLARIDVVFRGVIYQCLADAISWAHTQTEMAIGFNLIVLRTALVATPSDTNNLTNNYPFIGGASTEVYRAEGGLISNPFIGGASTQVYQATGNLISGTFLDGSSTQSYITSGDLINFSPVFLGGSSTQIYTVSGDLSNDTSGTLWDFSQITTDFWIDLQDTATITVSSGVIDAVADKSGNSRNATQTGSSRPAYQATGFNGFPCAFMADITDFFNLPTIPRTDGQLVFAIVDTTDCPTYTGTQGYLPFMGNFYLGFPTGNQFRPLYIEGGSYFVAPQTGRRKYGVMLYYSSTSGGIQIDASSTYTQTLAGTSGNWNTYLCIDATAFSDYSTAGIKLCEVAIVNSASVNSTNINKAWGYLMWKWGLESLLPSGHPYKTAAPTV